MTVSLAGGIGREGLAGQGVPSPQRHLRTNDAGKNGSGASSSDTLRPSFCQIGHTLAAAVSSFLVQGFHRPGVAEATTHECGAARLRVLNPRRHRPHFDTSALDHAGV